MKTATVRELRNRYTQLLKWIEAGEEIRITRRGVVLARLGPESRDNAQPGVDWTQSAALHWTGSNYSGSDAKSVFATLEQRKIRSARSAVE